jgi:hypothetical protein
MSDTWAGGLISSEQVQIVGGTLPDNSVQIRVGADMSAVKAQFAQLGGSANEAFRHAAGGAEPLDRALLGNRESVRLLSEEMGI